MRHSVTAWCAWSVIPLLRIKIEEAPNCDVYCLHIPDYHHFAVEGGVIVHNCYDELAYALASRPYTTTREDVEIEEYEEALRNVRKTTDHYATL